MLTIVLILTTTLASSLAQYASIENADGSYSIGVDSYQEDMDTGDTAEALLALLTKAQGWTETTVDDYGYGNNDDDNNDDDNNDDDSNSNKPPVKELREAFTDVMDDTMTSLQRSLRYNYYEDYSIVELVVALAFEYFKEIMTVATRYIRNWAFGNSYGHHRFYNRY